MPEFFRPFLVNAATDFRAAFAGELRGARSAEKGARKMRRERVQASGSPFPRGFLLRSCGLLSSIRRRARSEHRAEGSAIGPGEIDFQGEHHESDDDPGGFEENVKRNDVHDDGRDERQRERDEPVQ